MCSKLANSDFVGRVSNYGSPVNCGLPRQICIYKTERLGSYKKCYQNHVAPLKVKKFLVPPVRTCLAVVKSCWAPFMRSKGAWSSKRGFLSSKTMLTPENCSSFGSDDQATRSLK